MKVRQVLPLLPVLPLRTKRAEGERLTSTSTRIDVVPSEHGVHAAQDVAYSSRVQLPEKVHAPITLLLALPDGYPPNCVESR